MNRLAFLGNNILDSVGKPMHISIMAPSAPRDQTYRRLRPWFAARGVANMLVPDVIRKTVAFVGHRVDGEFVPEATAFFVSLEDHGYQFLYIVTADHVIAKMIGSGKDMILRTNKKDGSVQEDAINTEAWIFTEENNKSDVAICSVSVSPDEDVFNIGLSGNFSLYVEKTSTLEMPFGVGDEIAIVGLFRSHYGMNKNVPIVRIGNIAAMAEEPVSTKEYGFLEAYLVEARSIGGLSGSPVFVSMPPMRVVNNRSTMTSGKQFYLLGLMHGHFDIKDLNSDTVTDKYTNAYGDINTGVGVVIPAWKIMELLMLTDVVEERRKAAEINRQLTAATPDASASQ